MKLNLHSLILALSLISISCASLSPGSDPIVVRSEQTQQIAKDTFEAFLIAERKFESMQADPTGYRKNSEVHKSAENIRFHAYEWLSSAKVITRTYKTSRNPNDRQSLIEATATLRAFLAEAEKYITEVKIK